MPPELPTPEEQKAIDKMVEIDIDFTVENDPLPVGFTAKCSFCKERAIETLEFEGGNNAELSVEEGLCEAHFAEYEKDEYAFRDKYAEKIDNDCAENLIEDADGFRE